MSVFMALFFGALTIMDAALGNSWAAALSGVACGLWLRHVFTSANRRVR